MIHLRIDNEELNSKRKMLCGIGPDLPEGDMYVFEGESLDHMITCEGCGGWVDRKLGTPIDQISTQPGTPGYAEWIRISRSWGFD